MKLIEPSYEIIPQAPGLEGIYKQIELAGRVCYKSEDKITEDSAKDFTDRMIKSGHLAMCEHGTVYLTVPYDNICQYMDPSNPYDRDIMCNPWVNYKFNSGYNTVWITSNYRWIIENNLEDWLQYLCEPTKCHEKRVTVKFNHDIGCGREILRHRAASFANESTRYCNYYKDKFGNEITCLIPHFINEENELEFEEDLAIMEGIYFKWIKKGYKAQDARGFLPLFTKSELVVTAFVTDWKYFFDLRTDIAKTGKPHPDLLQVTNPLYNEFINLKLI
jgi:thymidylate synthase (FAD)